MKIALLNLILLISLCRVVGAQQDSTDQSFDDFFSEKIVKYEGLHAPIFKAPDTDGNIHYLDYYSDHIVILHFWQIYNDADILQIQSLNRIIKEYFDKGVVVLGFAINDTEDINNLRKKQEIDYPIIPNSMTFAAEHYGGELGLPRVFLIDKYGIIQKVTTGGSYYDPMDLYNRLVPYIEEHLKY